MQLIIDRTENLLSQRQYSNVTPWLQPGTGRGVWLSNRHVNLSGNKECLVQKYLYCLDYNTITKVFSCTCNEQRWNEHQLYGIEQNMIISGATQGRLSNINTNIHGSQSVVRNLADAKWTKLVV